MTVIAQFHDFLSVLLSPTAVFPLIKGNAVGVSGVISRQKLTLRIMVF